MKYIAGMIDRISEEVQKLPLINKAAYRRYIMEKCVAMKETLEEFDGYVKSAKESWKEDADEEGLVKKTEKLTVEDVDDDDEDEEEEEDEREYTKEEVSVVEPSVELIRLTLNTSKATLNIMTSVADKVVAASSSSASSAEEDSVEAVKKCQYWVASLTQLVADLENDVIDFGSELYPPIVNEEGSTFQEQKQQLVSTISKCLTSLQDPVYTMHLDESQSNAIQTLQTTFTSLSI